MKKSIIFLIIVCCLMTNMTVAQSKTYVGLKAGPSASFVDFFHTFEGYIFKSKPLYGLTSGVVVMHYLDKQHIGIQSELNYSRKGWRQTFPDGTADDYVTQMDYLELPLMFSLYSGNKKNHLFVSAGCYVEYLLNVKKDDAPVMKLDPNKSTLIGISDFPEYDAQRDNKFGYGFRAAGGMFHDFSFGTLMLEAFASISLSNFIKPDKLYTEFELVNNEKIDIEDSPVPNSSRNIVVGLTLSYLLSFENKSK